MKFDQYTYTYDEPNYDSREILPALYRLRAIERFRKEDPKTFYRVDEKSGCIEKYTNAGWIVVDTGFPDDEWQS